MKYPLTFGLIIVLTIFTSEGTSLYERKAINLKTNVIHVLFGPPPLHIEFQTKPKQSLSFGAYYADFVFFNRLREAGSHLSYRFYFNNKARIQGFYLGIGTNARVDLNDIDNAPSFNFFKNFFIGIRPSLGFQFQAKRWVFDMGAAYVLYPDKFHPNLNIGVGYRIW